MVAIEEYERSLGLEEELTAICRKVAFDVLGRAGFRAWGFAEVLESPPEELAELEERLQEYASRAEHLPDLLAQKGSEVYAIMLLLTEQVLGESRRRALLLAREYSMIPAVFTAAVNVSIPFSSLELVR